MGSRRLRPMTAADLRVAARAVCAVHLLGGEPDRPGRAGRPAGPPPVKADWARGGHPALGLLRRRRRARRRGDRTPEHGAGDVRAPARRVRHHPGQPGRGRDHVGTGGRGVPGQGHRPAAGAVGGRAGGPPRHPGAGGGRHLHRRAVLHAAHRLAGGGRVPGRPAAPGHPAAADGPADHVCAGAGPRRRLEPADRAGQRSPAARRSPPRTPSARRPSRPGERSCSADKQNRPR